MMKWRRIAALAVGLSALSGRVPEASAVGLRVRAPGSLPSSLDLSPAGRPSASPVQVPPPPTVTRVVQTSGNRAYKAGDTVSFKLVFDQAVVLDTFGGTPSVQLETGSVDRFAFYVSGSGSSDLRFDYLVQPGDGSADLQYLGPSAFALGGGIIVSVATGDPASLTLPGLASGLSLAETSAIVIDTTPPPPPSTPDLDPASDSGASNVDNLTNDDTPTFNGSSEANAQVTLVDTDRVTAIGTGTANGAGQWSITCGALAFGAHVIAARASDSAGNTSGLSGDLGITIVNTPLFADGFE